MNVKVFIILLFSAAGIVASCNSKNETQAVSGNEKATDTLTRNNSGSNNVDTAISYLHLKKYLPLSIPGFKTEGYPDTADRFTGEPTGETGSAYTSGGKISFIKHLYKQGKTELAIEIIDYKPAADTYKGLYKMYDFQHMENNEQRRAELINTGIPGVQVKQVYNKEENNITLYAFICDRFIINIQVVNLKKMSQGSDALKLIKLEELIKDHCAR